MGTRIVVDHLARVEGHGGITVEMEDDRVVRAHFEIFEGLRLLEGLVRGRSWRDVPQIVSRICAICSASHALTAIKAIENGFGVRVTPQTLRLRDLLSRGESIESHALHVFLLAVPDYLGYPGATAMAADHPELVGIGLRLKKLGNLIQSVVGGREIHPVNCIVGGFSRLPSVDDLISLRDALRRGLEDFDRAVPQLAQLPVAESAAEPLQVAALRTPHGYGYYEGAEVVFRRLDDYRETTPGGFRDVVVERAVAHSNAKHSSFDGKPFMVGALARLSINGDRLADRAVAAIGALGLRIPSDDVLDNNKAQAVELCADLEAALGLVERMLADGLQPESLAPVTPRAATGTAITEAPRGLLLHSYTFDAEGLVITADVITPTALNAASVEERFRFAVERATDRSDAALTRTLEMIARAYDPCISCSVHLIRRDDRA